MRANYKSYIFLILLCFTYSCKKDAKLVILNLKTNCVISSDTSGVAGNNGYSTYQFEGNSNMLTVAKKIVGNGIIRNYREVHYYTSNIPDKTITYTNANEFYETKFFYINGSSVPYKTELYYSNRQNGQPAKNLSRFYFRHDENNRLKEVSYVTAKPGEKDYTVQIFYNENNNVSRLQFRLNKGPVLADTLVTASAFDDKTNPYSSIPYWKYLMLNDSWDSSDPEPIITALSKNNPLDFTIGKLKREMVYTYNQNGLPLTRTNINKQQNGQDSFKESFAYRCR